MGNLLQNTNNDVSISAPTEVEYKIITDDPHIQGGDKKGFNSDETMTDTVNVAHKDHHGTDQMFMQTSELGNYYYEDTDDSGRNLNKRDDDYKERIYSLIKQDPRHSQRVSLQDLPRGRSSMNVRDKMGRSQTKKHPPKPLVSQVKAPETVCEADSDGTMPMRCPSNIGTCLYDAMICDGIANCPKAEDESFPLCVLRHWTTKWYRKHPSSS